MLRRLFRESLIYGLSRYIGKFIGIFLLPLYTAALSPEDYGILDLLNTITIVSTFLIVSGTDSALGYYYYRKEHLHDRPVMISSSLWLRLILAAAVFIIITLGSKVLSGIIFGRDYSVFVVITAMTLAFGAVYSFLFDLLRFEFRPWLFTIISGGGILLHILLTIYYVLILRKGVYGALTAGAIAYGFFFIVTVIYVFSKYGLHFSPVWFRNILSYGFPLIGTGIAVWVLNSTDRYFLAHYTDLSSVGIYSVGMKLASFLGMVAGALQMAWGPFAGDIQFHEKARKIYAKVFLIYFIVNTIGIFLISLFAIDILKVFTQPAYYSAKAVVPFLCTSAVLASGYFIAVTGMHLAKKLQHTIWITVGAAGANILMNFLLTPGLGVVGAALSIMTSNLIILLMTLAMSQRHYHIGYSYRRVLFMMIPAAIMIAFSYYFDLRLLPRIILTVFYLAFAASYLYANFKDSNEYRKVIESVGKLKSFSWKEPEEKERLEV